MKLTTKITPTDLKSETFTNEQTKEVIPYFQVQFIDEVMKKVGDEYRAFPDLATVGCSKEILDQLTVGEEVEVVIRCKATNPASGFPKVKYTIAEIV